MTVVNGYGLNHGQFANWQQAYDPAFEEFMANFVMQVPAMGIQGSSR